MSQFAVLKCEVLQHLCIDIILSLSFIVCRVSYYILFRFVLIFYDVSAYLTVICLFFLSMFCNNKCTHEELVSAKTSCFSTR